MATEVASSMDVSQPIVRRKAISAKNYAGLYTEIDTGEYGTLVTDEPVEHGGTGEGPSPLQTVLGALLGCESVTFSRTAAAHRFGPRLHRSQSRRDRGDRRGVPGGRPHQTQPSAEIDGRPGAVRQVSPSQPATFRSRVRNTPPRE